MRIQFKKSKVPQGLDRLEGVLLAHLQGEEILQLFSYRKLEDIRQAYAWVARCEGEVEC
jgi:hypothetical protein